MMEMKNLRENGWQVSHWRLKELLGLRGEQKLPPEGMDGQYVGNTWVYVLSQDVRNARHGRKCRGHRAMAVCNVCYKHVPAGRLHQHRKVHPGDKQYMLVGRSIDGMVYRAKDGWVQRSPDAMVMDLLQAKQLKAVREKKNSQSAPDEMIGMLRIVEV